MLEPAGNNRVNRRTRAERFEVENLSRVPGYAGRSPTDDRTRIDAESV